MKRRMIIAISALWLTSCASQSATDSPPAARPPAAATCDASDVQYHVGSQATQEIGTAILEQSGARTLRWGSPLTAWSMDYRQDRVNVRYDAAMTITRITCG